MSRYVNGSNATWSSCVERLRDTFNKWGVGFENWEVENSAVGAARNTYKSDDDRAVTVHYRPPGRQDTVTMRLDSQDTPAKNLSAIAITIEGIRMQERRGLGNLAAQHYLALASPATTRDPLEVLGLRPDASSALIDAAYKTLAKTVHSDVGGSDTAMTELNEAREAALERTG